MNKYDYLSDEARLHLLNIGGENDKITDKIISGFSCYELKKETMAFNTLIRRIGDFGNIEYDMFYRKYLIKTFGSYIEKTGEHDSYSIGSAIGGFTYLSSDSRTLANVVRELIGVELIEENRDLIEKVIHKWYNHSVALVIKKSIDKLGIEDADLIPIGKVLEELRGEVGELKLDKVKLYEKAKTVKYKTKTKKIKFTCLFLAALMFGVVALDAFTGAHRTREVLLISSILGIAILYLANLAKLAEKVFD